MKKECLNPESLFSSRQYGFSQVVMSNAGKHVFISGQVAWDENLNIIGEGDLGRQTQKSIENLKTAIETAGGSLTDIVMLRIYIVDYKSEDSEVISTQLKEYFGETPPASTWINVQGLANKDFMIEIEAQAII